MPELPEVETVKRGLEKLVIGKTIVDVSFDWVKSFPNESEEVGKFLKGSSIESISRRAKVLILELSSEYSLVIHLKMTGQLVFRGEQNFGAGHPNESLIAKLPDKSTRVTLTFSDRSKLFFNDQRKFGWVKLIETQKVEEQKFIASLGPEPLVDSFTPALFIKQIRRRQKTSIKAALLDQAVLAGVGNIYADESLWGAKIHPASKVQDVTDSRLRKLHAELIYVLNLSIEKGGSTDRNYVNAEGKKGSYIQFARVFRRENQPCPRCGAIIEKTRVAGRGTHTCPKCQILALD